MSNGQKPPAGKSWVWLTREVLESEAWLSLSNISARRLIDFLMIEHMRQSGKRNGSLLAPRRQLIEFGIHPGSISDAIAHVVRIGLVDVRRGTGRRPSVYALLWLPLGDGSAPSNRWRSYRADSRSETVSTTNESDFASDWVGKCTHKGRSRSETALAASGRKLYSPSRTSYHGKAEPGAADDGRKAPLPNGAGRRR